MSRKTARHRIPIALLVLLAAGSSCTFTALDTGGSSGTEISRVNGSIVDENGAAVSGARIRLRPDDFLVDSASDTGYTARHSILDTTSASDGSFSFSEITPDNYVLEATVGDSLGASAELDIKTGDPETTLTALPVAPMAQLSGNAQVNYRRETAVTIRVYGTDRAVVTDTNGNFNLHVPYGRHHLHISASVDSIANGDEFDGVDVALQVTPGEDRDAGSFRLREPLPSVCTDGTCDSMSVRSILDRNGLRDLPLDSVTTLEKGRIVSLNLRGFQLSDNIPFEINRLSALRILDLGKTGLTTVFPDIGRMPELETVYMDGNFLKEFSRSIGYCKKLSKLDIHGNQLEWLSSSVMDCPLELLDVSDNRLCSVDSTLAAWLDRNDPDWNENQRCR